MRTSLCKPVLSTWRYSEEKRRYATRCSNPLANGAPLGDTEVVVDLCPAVRTCSPCSRSGQESGLGTLGQKLAGTTINTTPSSSPALHIDFVTGPSSRLGGGGGAGAKGRGGGVKESSGGGRGGGVRGESGAVQFWWGRQSIDEMMGFEVKHGDGNVGVGVGDGGGRGFSGSVRLWMDRRVGEGEEGGLMEVFVSVEAAGQGRREIARNGVQWRRLGRDDEDWRGITRNRCSGDARDAGEAAGVSLGPVSHHGGGAAAAWCC